jgi:hypothetical protein
MILEWRLRIASIATYKADVHQLLTTSAGDIIIRKRLLERIFIVYISGIPETGPLLYIVSSYDNMFVLL